MDAERVIRSAGLIGLMTLISRGMGFIRDVLMAGLFGTSAAMSAFVIAFRVPNLFRALFGEGALSAAFIPVFVETRQREGAASAWDLARRVFTAMAVVLSALVAIGIIAATAVRAGLPQAAYARLVLSLLRIMLPYTLFICLAAVAMAALNSFGRFALPAAIPWILNATMIAAMLGVCPRLGPDPHRQIYGVAWAVLVAGLLQWLGQIPQMIRLGFKPVPRWPGRDPRLLRMLALMGPVAVGRAVTQVNVALDTFLAGLIGQWAAAALYFSERLIYLPMGIFATALSTVLLPLLSTHAARGDREAIRTAVRENLCTLLFVMVPAGVGLWALSTPIVRMSFQWRQFDQLSTVLTARALRFYAAGMIAFSLGKVFVPAFYALQDMRTPVRIGVATVILNMGLSVLFMLTWPLEYKHAGIACATVVAETLNGVWLASALHRRVGPIGWRPVARSVARILGCAMLAAVSAAALQARLYAYLLGSRLPDKLLEWTSGLAAIAAAVVLYLLLAQLIRAPEWRLIRAAILRQSQPER